MQPKALAGLKVIELADVIAGPYCGKLLADLGAEVIKVESPSGDRARKHGPFPNDEPDPERSGLFLYLNAGKLGMTLDITSASGREILRSLAAKADIIIESFDPGWLQRYKIDYGELSAVNPGLIMTSITPFGQEGPYKDYKGTDLICIHLGGLGYGIPGRVEDPSLPPLKAGGRQADFLAGMTGATAAMHAVFAREQDGLGTHVDVSIQDAVATVSYANATTFDCEGRVPTRLRAEGEPAGPTLMLPCKDGFFCFSAMEERHWKDWVELMGNPDWAQQEIFQTRASRFMHWESIELLIADWSQHYTKEELYRRAQSKRIPVTAVYGIDEVINSTQLTTRDAFVEVEHPVAGTFTYPGAPYKLSETPWHLGCAAPTLGQHNEIILCQRLGYSRDSLAELKAAGII